MINQVKTWLLRKLIKHVIAQRKGSLSDVHLVQLHGLIIQEVRDNFETYDDQLKNFQAECHRQALGLY